MKAGAERADLTRLYLAVGSGAAIGSLLRFLSGVAITSGLGLKPLWTTVFVNVLGSFVIAFFATLTGPDGRLMLSPARRQFVMAGICGGFTTFSAMSLDSFVLMLDGDPIGGVIFLGAVVFFSLAAAWAGHLLALRINR